jgi:two-component system sensor histidine kinase/response regulator
MPDDPHRLVSSQILSGETFERLSQLLQKAAYSGAGASVVVTEDGLSGSAFLIGSGLVRFVLALGQGFSGLLLARSHSTLSSAKGYYDVTLIFEPADIAMFAANLSRDLAISPSLKLYLSEATHRLEPNEIMLQSRFTLDLAALLHEANGQKEPLGNFSLQQRVEQDQLISEVATQIRQSQDLRSILVMSVERIQLLLHADRVIIYQFNTERLSPFSPTSLAEPSDACTGGQVVYEARADDQLMPILHLGEGALCFADADYREKYRQGGVVAVEDIDITYAHAPCLLALLQRTQVRAKLIAPILVQEQLWGLIIAQQCFQPRHWQADEQTFLACIAEHLAIAIYQTQLNQQLRHQTQTLEQQVIERTQNLYDALNAAQSASLTKAEFLAAMNHELRTPLTCIIGMSATLQRLLAMPQTNASLGLQRQQNYLKTIQASGESLLKLVNDILELSQIEAGRAVLDVREFSLTQLAADALHTVQHMAHQRHIHLVFENHSHTQAKPSMEGDRFLADPRRVSQILVNLLSNAIKFTPAEGTVRLKMWTESNLAIFQVEDTGIGIPQEQLPLLFKKFQQLDMSYHRQYEGTGLGLALTKHLVDLHSGQIEVRSTVNVGSVFTVHLPAQMANSDHSAPATDPPQNGHSRKRIVLLESHEETATLICDLLTAAGYQVVWMVDGTTAYHQIEILSPAMVLIGTQLAGILGADLVRWLRQNPLTEAIKILALQPVNGNQVNQAWMSEQIDGWLLDPTSYPEQLLEKVLALDS